MRSIELSSLVFIMALSYLEIDMLVYVIEGFENLCGFSMISTKQMNIILVTGIKTDLSFETLQGTGISVSQIKDGQNGRDTAAHREAV